ncbi:glycosyltransferase family 92 protein F13G3.3-like isoform X3 [Parambassis ranga]|uniref:Glycosyltransferase family 92 protein n=1 Tax=Parambassis ranga TaxID=210632 RepID=A0A6P7HDD3_9TELE|nr:glycosyltransferase family 92 protein F13G3.3-like isoform X3 [Parambassis ranga]XP_028252047.1 glycosyltransferase family 92 protein F13G3.3-like isoform X3 [Parambassis ranga]XP_028252048.1 glycosyltransferase family 92 protein F13G3.3-like isoform X3 [Parambassis ranga]XP_028252049.1 glycosyltransferase family 92 protein F13G3.3-like isoform X3 [Parambassis ranga]XP_028252050.1 glycosyltransferase family 92 protein F13G3.3-like isoform X3 [Parambassis ranga]
MDSAKNTQRKLLLFILIGAFIIFFFISDQTSTTDTSIPPPRRAPINCGLGISSETITPLQNTKHLLVSAYIDQRVKGLDLRIIGIFRRDSIQPLHCAFCCAGWLSKTSPSTILQHADNFGFPFVTTDVMCPIPTNCNATHVTLLTEPDRSKVFNQTWLPIRNKRTDENKEKFTVCISNLFGDYNNVLQYAQTLEMYRLLGVDRVVIYNTSCGPDLNHLLQSYSQEGFVEMVPWPIDKHLNPSHGWLFSEHGGDVHYFGQLTTLNDCIYRSMELSRYVMLNDIDEIIMPYQHNDLKSLMSTLEQSHPNTGVFPIENHIFPYQHFEPSKRFHLPQWNGVPGVNILEHIYREDPNRNIYHPYKLIVRPESVEQTSVHEVLKRFGQQYKVPPEVCRLIHVRTALRGSLTLKELNVDKRLWDFHEMLIPKVDQVLKRVGLLNT